ncbi:hypothetical protein Afil01_06490 [Actinorhabdospora filicis]|uniref:Uncharacterized protein n=1 Tax=Actinorhabdospora filicis TaxID=1785913 RepID=A0A9W6SHA6_9ACTN|nr:hypothetical protein [Actinorhabdospora filicis]GLZ75842.1 hypothetical protein Afil01_06490 [Actinorhabdospora filicis]
MTVLEAVLTFVGIPLVVVLIIVGLVYGPSGGPKSRRYRPGRPFTFTPVWFLARPEEMSLTGAGTDVVPSSVKALPAGSDEELTGLVSATVKGGASGSW